MKSRLVVGPPPIKYVKKYANGGALTEFEKAFAQARKEKGKDQTFTYKGKLYSTNYKEEGYSKTTGGGSASSSTRGFDAAFKEARARLGAGKTFTYNGKEYSTNYATEVSGTTQKTTQTPKTETKPTPKTVEKPEQGKVESTAQRSAFGDRYVAPVKGDVRVSPTVYKTLEDPGGDWEAPIFYKIPSPVKNEQALSYLGYVDKLGRKIMRDIPIMIKGDLRKDDKNYSYTGMEKSPRRINPWVIVNPSQLVPFSLAYPRRERPKYTKNKRVSPTRYEDVTILSEEGFVPSPVARGEERNYILDALSQRLDFQRNFNIIPTPRKNKVTPKKKMGGYIKYQDGGTLNTLSGIAGAAGGVASALPGIGPIVGAALNSVVAPVLGALAAKQQKRDDINQLYSNISIMEKGGLIKRKDGSYSKRGLWDNIRANRGSGKKPTKQMLEQERKIKASKEFGGTITGNSDLSFYKGKSHRDGGIMVNSKGVPSRNASAEVEGGETRFMYKDKAYIFSDKLTV